MDSLKCRWKRLNGNGNKWVAACRAANARKRSGMSDQDVENEAHSIYKGDGGNDFQDLIVFNEVMSKHEKWSVHDATQVFPDNENFANEQDDLHALRLAKDNENEIARARLQLEREKLDMPSMKMYQKMLLKLLEKEHLSPEDQDMKRNLTEIVFGK
ncbi:hypothetical protein SASPL_130623 [Salvia splendens]|uniref:Uncharacterized protein n=1 Tax=Salvia splendens TaxID=180675 RepID=A0A8X8ZJL9_SALSN|nr:hypothetical protein SASPL_130623 [Salvia splendens]